MKVIKKSRTILVLVILVVFVVAANITTFASVCTGTCRISNHAVLSEPTSPPEYDIGAIDISSPTTDETESDSFPMIIAIAATIASIAAIVAFFVFSYNVIVGKISIDYDKTKQKKKDKRS